MKRLKKAIVCLAVVVLMGANSLSAFAATTYGNCNCGGTYYFYYMQLVYTDPVKTYHTVSYIHEHDVCTITTEYYDVVGRCDRCGNISWVAQDIKEVHSLPHN